jgi:hypothetical protein
MAEQKHPYSTNLPQRGFIVFDDGDHDAMIGCGVRYASTSGGTLSSHRTFSEMCPRRIFCLPYPTSARKLGHTSDWDDGKHCVVIWRMWALIGVEFT